MLRREVRARVGGVLRIEEVVVVGDLFGDGRIAARGVGVEPEVAPVDRETSGPGPRHREVNALPRQVDLESVVVFRGHRDVLERVVVFVAVDAVTVGVGIEVVAVPDALLADGLVGEERVACGDHRPGPLHILFGADHAVARAALRVDRAVAEEVAAVALVGVEQVELVDELAFHHAARGAHGRGDVAEVGVVDACAVLAGHPARLEAALVLGHFVPVAREIGRDAVGEILDPVAPSERQFQAVVGHLAEVLVGGALLADGGEDRGLIKDAVGHFVIVVHFEAEAVVQHAQLQTDVGRRGGFPLQQVVRERGHDARRLLAAERVEVARGVGRLILVIADGVVAQFAPRGAQLEVVDARILHERLLRDAPSGRYRGEQAPARLAGEARRTVVTEVRFKEVAVVVGVGQAAEERSRRKVGLRAVDARHGGRRVEFHELVLREAGFLGREIRRVAVHGLESHEGREVVFFGEGVVPREIVLEGPPVGALVGLGQGQFGQVFVAVGPVVLREREGVAGFAVVLVFGTRPRVVERHVVPDAVGELDVGEDGGIDVVALLLAAETVDEIEVVARRGALLGILHPAVFPVVVGVDARRGARHVARGAREIAQFARALVSP